MTIEFSCSHCDKVLKTSDDKAGRRAKCPQCGEAVTVPQPASAVEDQGFDGFDEFDESVPEEESFLAGGPVREADSFLAGGDIECPMCGASLPAGAKKCSACGETLKASKRSGREHWEPRVISIGDVFSRAWSLYKANLGMSLAVPLLAGVIYFVGSLVVGIASGILQAALLGGAGQNADPAILIPITLIQNLFVYAIYFYLQLGGQLLFLQMVRGESPDLGGLFSGGPFFWRMVLCSFVYAIFVILGSIALVIPGIIVSLMFWPFSFILVDRNLPGLESFWESRKVTDGNKLNLLGLSLLLGGITILGTLVTLGIGAIFIIPFTYMAHTVAYAEMTSQ